LQFENPLFSHTQKGADVFVRDVKHNSAVHFPAVSYSVDIIVAYSVDIIKLLLGKRTSVKLTKVDDKNPQHISTRCGNLEARNLFFYRGAYLMNPNKYGDTPQMEALRNGKLNVFIFQ